MGIFMLCGCASRDPRGARIERVGLFDDQQSAAPSVQELDIQGLQRLVHDRKGTILLLNFWATWCQPCIKELPDLIRLSKFYKGNELEVVGVSVDYPDETKSKIIPLLKEHRVPFKIYVAKFDKQDDFINAVDTSWNGAVPATFIYGPRGTHRYSWIGQGSFSRFKQEVEKLKAGSLH